MKYNIWFILLLITNIGYSQQELFDKANTAYEENDYEKAALLYDSLLQEYQSFETYYNLGNTYLKLNEYPKAMLMYEKARKIKHNDEDLENNIVYTKELLNLEKSKSTKRLGDLFNDLATWQIIPVWQYIAIGLLLVTCTLIIFFFYSPKKSALRAVFFYTAILTTGLMATAYFLSYRQYKTVYSTKEGIVMPFKVDVYGEPSKHSNEVFEINAGYKVKILDEVNEWYEIAINNGNIGWTLKENVAPIRLNNPKK